MVKSCWDLLYEAIKSGKTDEALQLAGQCADSYFAQHNSLASFVGMALNRLARFDEAEIEKLCRERYSPLAKSWLETTPGARESVEKFAGLMQSAKSRVTIEEDAEKYVLTLDPCRTGGRLRQAMSVAGAALGAGIGTTKKAYPWCWGMKGISYYCIHECVFLEIVPTELRGYPIAVVQYAARSEDPCVLFFYKKPELIPEKYFARIGKTKTIK